MCVRVCVWVGQCTATLDSCVCPCTATPTTHQPQPILVCAGWCGARGGQVHVLDKDGIPTIFRTLLALYVGRPCRSRDVHCPPLTKLCRWTLFEAAGMHICDVAITRANKGKRTSPFRSCAMDIQAALAFSQRRLSGLPQQFETYFPSVSNPPEDVD